MRRQASLLAPAALTAEVDTLKQNLERSEQYLIEICERCNCKK